MKRFAFVTLLAIASCTSGKGGWSSEELRTIDNSGNPLMRVLTIDAPADSLFLRQNCTEFTAEMLQSEEYGLLADKMMATVQSPEQDGVGIAGPQVGISRRVVAVQRFDKEGEPFEVYPNIYIVAHYGEKQLGREGCLSVPGYRGQVMRWRDIDICYTSPVTLKDTVENVKGFTAVIFQHETDHLDGVLYIDLKEELWKE